MSSKAVTGVIAAIAAAVCCAVLFMGYANKPYDPKAFNMQATYGKPDDFMNPVCIDAITKWGLYRDPVTQDWYEVPPNGQPRVTHAHWSAYKSRMPNMQCEAA